MKHFRSKKDGDSGEGAPKVDSTTENDSASEEISAQAGTAAPVENSAEKKCETPEKESSANENSAEENSAGTEASSENAAAEKLVEELEKLRAELLKTKDAYLRTVAEFDNYRRRNNEEKPKIADYAKGDLAKDIFPILDNFKLGIDAAEKQHPEAKSITEGFAMIASQLRGALGRHNIVEIDPAGKPFDPNEHESLTSQPSADVPEDHVLFVHRVGYKIGDRLLRPASVVISSGAPEKKDA